MGFLDKLFGNKSDEQAVIVNLSAPDESNEDCDLSTIEDMLIEVINRNRLGEFDGNCVDLKTGEAQLFMYGPDAERLFSGIEATLRSDPICKNARVIIRKGKPGAEQREVTL